MSKCPYVIVGAGPAGLQLAYFLAQAGHDFVVLEAAPRAGAFFETFPRHRRLLSINKRFNLFGELDFNLRHDWNSLLSDNPELRFTQYSAELFPDADDLTRYLRDFAGQFADRIRYDSKVRLVTRHADGGFDVATATGERYRCDRLIMATGATAPYLPNDIEGIEHAVGYETHSLDPAEYEGQVVAVVGAGNSAFEVANHLAAHAAVIHILVRRPLRFAWDTHFPGDLRAINNTILDMYQLKSMHLTVGFWPTKITPLSDGKLEVTLASDHPHWDSPSSVSVPMRYDQVIRCTGWRYVDPTIFAPDCRPKLDELGKFPVLSNTWESSVPGLYFAGTAMQARDRRAASSFIHGFRYNVRTLFNLFQERFHGVPYPSETVPLGDSGQIRAFAEALLRRVSTTGSLYQQFGVLCDAIVFDDGKARWFRSLPVDYVRENHGVLENQGVLENRELTKGDLVTVTLEYGFHKYPRIISPLYQLIPNDPDQPECTAFIHPVLRLYRDGQLVEELPFGESLFIRYDQYPDADTDGHVRYVENFLTRLLGGDVPRLSKPRLYTVEIAHQTVTPWSQERRNTWRPAIETDTSQAECRFTI